MKNKNRIRVTTVQLDALSIVRIRQESREKRVSVLRFGSGWYVSQMNLSLMGMMFGGTIAEVMGHAGKDVSDAVSTVVAK